MNEKFLSRGKRKDTGKWVEGYYFEHNGDYAIVDLNDRYNGVIPETVGLFTGLTDKNGAKIFEGDFIQVHGLIFVVKFGKCGGVQNVDTEVGYIGFYVEPIGKDAKLFSDSGLRTDILYWINSFGVEIIGNIHDTPELIGGTE